MLSCGLNAKQITVWHQKEGGTEVLQELFKKLESEFGVSFSVSYLATNDLKSALITSALSRRQPDIVLIPSDFFGEHRSFKLKAIPESLKADLPIDNSAWAQSKVGNRYYGIPIYIGNHMLLYYNKSIIRSPATSWEQMINQRAGLDPAHQLIGWNYNELFWFIHIISGFDAYPVIHDKVNLNTRQFAKALKFYRDIGQTGIVPSNCDYSCSSQRFIDGEFAYVFNGDWAYSGLKKAMGENLGVAPLPTIQGHAMQSYYSTINLVFPGRDDAAPLSSLDKAILNTLLTEENLLKMYSSLGLLPSNQKLRASFDVTNKPEYKQVLLTLEQAIPLPSSVSMTAAWAGMRKGLDNFQANDISPERACSIMQKVAERELARLKDDP